MKVHFEYPSGITQDDLMFFLHEKGLSGVWTDWDLNIFELVNFTSEQYTLLETLCHGFHIKGVPVRGYVMIPPPPKLQRF